ncbi:MAG TPA: homoserine O-acetyltransferase [Clostridia bacterium]|nr:homoserine O-acetyltransferase [Clostridia bacterium]
MGDIGIVRTEYYSPAVKPWVLESGKTLPEITIAYETYGTLNAAGDNAILVCHALTGDAHAAGRHTPQDRLPGWWDPLIGPGKALDTDKYFVVCSNVLGGCSGTTGPSSINPATGKPYGMDFPVITIRDMVRVQKTLLDYLGVKKLVTVVGGSMGGMQVLEWAVHYSDMLRSAIPIATAGRLAAQTIAYNQTQREAIFLDPHWNGGNYYDGEPPRRGLALARMIGTITYKSLPAWENKFARAFSGFRPGDYYEFQQRFEVENYLLYQGEKLVKRFDANTYLYLTKAMDLHDIGYPFNSYEEAFRRIKVPVLSIGVSSDFLYPTYQQKEIVSMIIKTGGQAYYEEIHSPYGHDGFLIEFEQQNRIISRFLKEVVG